MGAGAIEELLEYAMAHRHGPAAAAAARLLGEVGKPEQLLYRGGGPSLLVQAAQDPDRRLRVAALEAVVRLRPAQPYAGCSRVAQGLGYLAASTGARRALVASANMRDAQDMAGMLIGAGFQVDTCLNGRDLLLAAIRSSDCELALIDVTIDHPTIATLLQQLRRDERTAQLRIGLIARAGYLDQAEHLAQTDPFSKAFSRPYDQKAILWQVDQLMAIQPQTFVAREARQQQAIRALELLADLNRSPCKACDVRGMQQYVIGALYNPKSGVKAAGVLGGVGSIESQRALVDVASRSSQPLAVRQAAAAAFCESTEKYGILLTDEEVREQYRRYADSAKLDRPTRRVLAKIIDCLEAGATGKK
jgi:hypothetical protein